MTNDAAFILLTWSYLALISGAYAPTYYARWTDGYPPLQRDPYLMTMALVLLSVSCLALVARCYDYVVTPDHFELQMADDEDSWFHR